VLALVLVAPRGPLVRAVVYFRIFISRRREQNNILKSVIFRRASFSKFVQTQNFLNFQTNPKQGSEFQALLESTITFRYFSNFVWFYAIFLLHSNFLGDERHEISSNLFCWDFFFKRIFSKTSEKFFFAGLFLEKVKQNRESGINPDDSELWFRIRKNTFSLKISLHSKNVF